MDPTTQTILIAAAAVGSVLLLIVTIGILAQRAGRRRTEELQSAAFSLGYDFLETDPTVLSGELTDLPFFARGRRGRVRNVWRRRGGEGESLLFDYRFTQGGGQHQSNVHQTVFARQGQAELPRFQLRPEHTFHRIGAGFGMQDIDFEDAPHFSKLYLVQGDDEEAVRTQLGVQARNWLELNPGWTAEGQGRWLVLTRAAKRVRPSEVDAFLRQCEELADHLLARR